MLHYAHQLVSCFVKPFGAERVVVYTGFIRAFSWEHLPPEPETRLLIALWSIKNIKDAGYKKKTKSLCERHHNVISFVFGSFCIRARIKKIASKKCAALLHHFIIWPFFGWPDRSLHLFNCIATACLLCKSTYQDYNQYLNQ